MSKQTQSTISKGIHLKASITTCKPHYIQKVISFRQTYKDGLDDRFTSNVDIYIPKLKLKYPKPCVMFYMKNGGGRCFIRGKSPNDLANKLDTLVSILRSDLWADIWLHLEDISQDINGNDFCNDKKFIDCDPVEDTDCY